MMGKKFRTPAKFGFELPGPKGPGFWRLDKAFLKYFFLFNLISVNFIILENIKKERCL